LCIKYVYLCALVCNYLQINNYYTRTDHHGISRLQTIHAQLCRPLKTFKHCLYRAGFHSQGSRHIAMRRWAMQLIFELPKQPSRLLPSPCYLVTNVHLCWLR
jgi:hypothetical protein